MNAYTVYGQCSNCNNTKRNTFSFQIAANTLIEAKNNLKAIKSMLNKMEYPTDTIEVLGCYQFSWEGEFKVDFHPCNLLHTSIKSMNVAANNKAEAKKRVSCIVDEMMNNGLYPGVPQIDSVEMITEPCRNYEVHIKHTECATVFVTARNPDEAKSMAEKIEKEFGECNWEEDDDDYDVSPTTCEADDRYDDDRFADED